MERLHTRATQQKETILKLKEESADVQKLRVSIHSPEKFITRRARLFDQFVLMCLLSTKNLLYRPRMAN